MSREKTGAQREFNLRNDIRKTETWRGRKHIIRFKKLERRKCTDPDCDEGYKPYGPM